MLFLGCSSNDNENSATTYEGVVIYEDDLSRETGATLRFLCMKRVEGIGQLDETIIERNITLSQDGSFRFELETTLSSIDYFGVLLFVAESPNSIDCAPNSCASLTPRTTFTEMRLVARRA